MADDFAHVLARLRDSRAFGKGIHQTRLFSTTMKLLGEPGGAAMLYRYAPQFDAAGVFAGGVWDDPAHLQPQLVRAALLGEGMNPPVESLSELRMLAIAQGESVHETVSPAAARAFLEDALARNLDLLFPAATEAARVQMGANAQRIHRLLAFIAQRLDSAGILAT
ncbi:MAG: hypothetical protein L0H63_13130, partial [Nitrococcus sp.]|nr:hypothetical protein [Nitrococcus sp.]